MSSYRINVRFNLEDDTERKAAEYLQELYCKEKKSRSRFIVEAVTAYMERIAEKDNHVRPYQQKRRQEHLPTARHHEHPNHT